MPVLFYQLYTTEVCYILPNSKDRRIDKKENQIKNA